MATEPVSAEEKAISDTVCRDNPHKRGHCLHQRTYMNGGAFYAEKRCCWCKHREDIHVVRLPEHGTYAE